MFIILFLFWLMLTFELSTANLITGAIAALISVLFFGKYFVRDVTKFLQPARYFWLIVYIIIFIWECVKANFDVAYRVLHPAMPIKPGIVRIRSVLKTDTGRTVLANSITLTPGTLTMEVTDDGTFYVHLLSVRTVDEEAAAEQILRRFEWFIQRVFE